MIYFVYLYTIIWPKYMVVFHLFFLLFKTIWQKIWVLIDLFLSFAYDHWTKICGLVWYILSLCTAIQPKVMLLINLFILFVHDHSTKIRGHSYSLVYYFLNWVNILYAVFMAVLSLYFVHYIHVSTGLYFVHNVHGYMKSSAILNKYNGRKGLKPLSLVKEHAFLVLQGSDGSLLRSCKLASG